MKNLIFLIALVFILFTSCSKDESIEQAELQTSDTVYIFNQHNETSSWDTMVFQRVKIFVHLELKQN